MAHRCEEWSRSVTPRPGRSGSTAPANVRTTAAQHRDQPVPIALLLLWVAAWNSEPWQTSDGDRRKLIAGAVAVVAATVGLMALDEADDPSVIRPGEVVVAGSPVTPAVCEVIDLVDKPAGTVVHLRVLPGTIDQYRRLLSRVGA